MALTRKSSKTTKSTLQEHSVRRSIKRWFYPSPMAKTDTKRVCTEGETDRQKEIDGTYIHTEKGIGVRERGWKNREGGREEGGREEGERRGREKRERRGREGEREKEERDATK